MINVVYLVLITVWGTGTATISIPQANMKQCEINRKSTMIDNEIKRSYCIVGVK